jgi:ComF family protein
MAGQLGVEWKGIADSTIAKRSAVSRGTPALSNPRRATFYNAIAQGAALATRAAQTARWQARLQARRLLPQSCALCAAPTPDALVCAACAAALPTLRDACPRCALPSTAGVPCGACLAQPPPFDATIAAHAYAFPVDRLLQALKYNGRLALADWAAATLAARVQAGRVPPPAPTVLPLPLLVPLPLAPPRQRQRGFNQAQEIARELGRLLALPVAPALLRTRTTPPQADLPWAERVRNVRGAFAARDRLDGAQVVLIDDVMTTGATLAAAATAARAAGAARVECWVVARTLPQAQS